MASQNTPLTPMITASASNISNDSLDCGFNAIGWCKSERFQKLARLRYFLPIFLLIGALHGASETYFRISTKQTTSYQNFDAQIIDWLLVSSYIFQALLAFIVGFWSQQFHIISWLGGLTIFQSVFCFFSVIPTLSHYDFDISSAKYDNMISTCKTSLNQTNSHLEEDKYSEPEYVTTKLVMLFLLQFGLALGFTAFYTIGLPYIDDNANIEDSPTLFASVLAINKWGYLIGFLLTFVADINQLNWWFGWVIIGPLLLILGTIITLFPRKLLRVVLKQAAQRIIDGSSLNPNSSSRAVQFLDDVNFIPSIRRLLTNKILLFNLLGLICVKMGIHNFYNLNEQNYLQSRFFFPTDESNGIFDEWPSRFLSYLLKPPITGTCMLFTGLIISRLKPSARFLSLWNIISGCLLVIIFLSYIFIDCSTTNLIGVRKGVITQPFCSRECICSTKDIFFSPVCIENSNQTYFSPCHAGCRNEVNLNDITFYENCTCGLQNSSTLTRATQGACNMKKCQMKWIIFQVLGIIAAAIYGTMLICKIIITMRSVLDQDKSLALSLELLLTGLMVYVVGKFIYDAVTWNTCAYWSFNYKKCLLQDSSLYGNILNFITITLFAIGTVLDVFVYIFTGDLDLFSRNPPYDEDQFRYMPPLLNASEGNNNNIDSSPAVTQENVPILQSGLSENQQQRALLQLPRQRPLRNTSPSSSSSSQISPVSPYRLQGAIPKSRIQRQQPQQPPTSETDF